MRDWLGSPTPIGVKSGLIPDDPKLIERIVKVGDGKI
jgi:hypothetical protein